MYKMPKYSQDGQLIEIAKTLKENVFCRRLSYTDFIKYIEEVEESKSIGLICDYILNFHNNKKYDKLVEFISYLKTTNISPKVADAVTFITTKLKTKQ